MRLLLDTHALIWGVMQSGQLSSAAYAAIADSRTSVSVSAATAWEITTKHRLGKLPKITALAADVGQHIAKERFEGLPVTVAHGQLAGSLPGPHKDPFDRMLIAQALLDGLTLVSNETLFDRYGVTRLW